MGTETRFRFETDCYGGCGHVIGQWRRSREEAEADRAADTHCYQDGDGWANFCWVCGMDGNAVEVKAQRFCSECNEPLREGEEHVDERDCAHAAERRRLKDESHRRWLEWEGAKRRLELQANNLRESRDAWRFWALAALAVAILAIVWHLVA